MNTPINSLLYGSKTVCCKSVYQKVKFNNVRLWFDLARITRSTGQYY